MQSGGSESHECMVSSFIVNLSIKGNNSNNWYTFFVYGSEKEMNIKQIINIILHYISCKNYHFVIQYCFAALKSTLEFFHNHFTALQTTYEFFHNHFTALQTTYEFFQDHFTTLQTTYEFFHNHFSTLQTTYEFFQSTFHHCRPALQIIIKN